MFAGYSGKPLVEKLGLKPGHAAGVVAAPPHYRELMGCEVPRLEPTPGEPDLDFIHLFVASQTELEAMLPALKGRLKPTGMLWVSWPKKASGVPTDVTETQVRDFGLATGLVDTKVCAVDQTWSGLKFMFRLRDR